MQQPLAHSPPLVGHESWSGSSSSKQSESMPIEHSRTHTGLKSESAPFEWKAPSPIPSLMGKKCYLLFGIIIIINVQNI